MKPFRHLLVILALAVAPGVRLPATAAAAEPSARLVASAESGWPQFRGPKRDGVSAERGLLQAWPESGPAALWTTTNLGRGFSSPVFSRDRIFLTGDVGEELHLFALDLAGRPLWTATNGASWKNPYPGARATAAFNNGRVFLQNAHGRVASFDAVTGRELWAVGLLETFGGKNITWGLSECLLVDDKAVYTVAGGSNALVVALDKTTGKTLWKSAPLIDSGPEQSVENAGYVSPILVEYAGRRLLLGCSLRHLFCADAADGRLLWTKRFPTTYNVLAMMPAFLGDGVFMTAPHGPPGRFYRFTPPANAGGDPGVEEGWTSKIETCQASLVHVDGRLYGSFYQGRKGWAAVDAKTGETLYAEPEFVKGAGLWADGRLYAYSEDGWLRLLQPTADKFEVRGQLRFAEARNDAWAHPVILDGRLYLRYHEKLVCFDVKAK